MNTWLISVAVVVIAVGTCMIVLVIHGTVSKTRWGINFWWSGECPSCHSHRNMIRIPRNLRQFLWGGGTCGHCGLEVDKWNRPVGS